MWLLLLFLTLQGLPSQKVVSCRVGVCFVGFQQSLATAQGPMLVLFPSVEAAPQQAETHARSGSACCTMPHACAACVRCRPDPGRAGAQQQVSPGEVEEVRARAAVADAVVAGRVDEAAGAAEALAPGVLAAHPRVRFRLHAQKFMELVRAPGGACPPLPHSCLYPEKARLLRPA